MVLLGFWFASEICCQMIAGDLERVFHVEAQIRAQKDAELARAPRRGGPGQPRRVRGKARNGTKEQSDPCRAPRPFPGGRWTMWPWKNGCLVLDSSAGRYLPYGSYTSPELAMPAFCNLNVSWNALAPANTMLEVRCRVYAGGDWTSWMSFGKWAPDYPRRSVHTQTEDGLVFLLGDTVTVAAPGGGSGIQLQVNLSTNDNKITPGGAAAGRSGAAPGLGPPGRGGGEPPALPAGIQPVGPRPQLWPGDGPLPGDGLPDEPLGGGYPPRGGGLHHAGLRQHRRPQRRLCGGGSCLLRLSQLAGLAGFERAAGPDPRWLFGGRRDGNPVWRARRSRCGSGWPCGALATTTR